MIGWYEDGRLQPRVNFIGRLDFHKENCSFVLKNVSPKDSNLYTITTRYMEGDKTKQQEITVNVTIHGDPGFKSEAPFTTMPTPERVQNLTACSTGFPAVCFSLAPAVNVILTLLSLVKCHQLIQEVLSSILSISNPLSLACQAISIFLWAMCDIVLSELSCGTSLIRPGSRNSRVSHGLLHICRPATHAQKATTDTAEPDTGAERGRTEDRRRTVRDSDMFMGIEEAPEGKIRNSPLCFTLAAIGFGVLVIVTILQYILACAKSSCDESSCRAIKNLWKNYGCLVMCAVLGILQSGFTLCAWMAFYSTHWDIVVQKWWALALFAVVYLLVVTVLGCLSSYNQRKTETKEAKKMEGEELKEMNPSKNAP
ncbi:uncharacterized protein [Hyperolius riggenbachi]|uniref:uncharacterized protein n=1 Tax=Hyperolius riggenbachi TaxID=752182 RepID=UPI0035A2889A